jgi:hypothetical protein
MNMGPPGSHHDIHPLHNIPAPHSDNPLGTMPRVNALLGIPAPLPPGERPTNLIHGYASNASYDQHVDDRGPQCTLRCTGLPQSISESDLYGHFVVFGPIVRLVLKRNSTFENQNTNADNDSKKIYNECSVQFLNEADAKKCFNSPAPVLNNRFIKIFNSNHNLVPSNEVQTVMEFEEVYDGAGSREEMSNNSSGTNEFVKRRWTGSSQSFRGNGRKTQTFSHQNQNKFSNTEKTPQGEADDSDAHENRVASFTEENGDESVTASNGGERRPPKPRHNAEEIERQRNMVHKKYEDLRGLRQKAETIWREKESLILVVLTE